MNELLPKKLAPYKLPHCWICYDMGNYEISRFSNGKELPKWKFGENVTEDHGKMYAQNNNVVEEEVYRIHCPACHPKFEKRHEELTSVILSEKTNIKEKGEARDELSMIWGMKPKRR